MFTTPTGTPSPNFIDGTGTVLGSRLRAVWLNYVSGQFPNALDAINGGYYQFIADIELSSDTAQIKVNAPDVAQPTKLLGFTTIGLSDDSNYATGTGTLTVAIPATFTAGVTISGAMTFSNTVQFNGAVTVNAATTFTSNGDITLQSGCAVTGSSGSSLTMASGSTTTLASANTLSGANTISGATTLSNVTALTLASAATCTLAANVEVATASRSYSRARMYLQYVNITYWFQDPLYVRSYPAVMSQILASGVAMQVDNVVWEADVPDAATITTVSWTISPVTAVRAGLPTMPKFWVEVVNVSTGAIVQSANVTDTSADVTAYETEHTITTAALNWTINRDVEMVLVRVQGEAGGTFETGMLAYAPICNFTRTKLAEE
jgi:hypothetical protein